MPRGPARAGTCPFARAPTPSGPWHTPTPARVGGSRARWARRPTLRHGNPMPGQDRASALGGDGTQGSPDTAWPRFNRLAVQPAPYVGPGQVAWFQFRVRAPVNPSRYTIALRPVIEGTTWMEDYGVFWYVTVLNPDGTPPPPPPPTRDPQTPIPDGLPDPDPKAVDRPSGHRGRRPPGHRRPADAGEFRLSPADDVDPRPWQQHLHLFARPASACTPTIPGSS